MRLPGHGLGQLRVTNVPTAPRRNMSVTPCLSRRPLQAAFEPQLRGLGGHLRSILRFGALNNEVCTPGGRFGVAWAWAYLCIASETNILRHLPTNRVIMVCGAQLTPLRELHTPLP